MSKLTIEFANHTSEVFVSVDDIAIGCLQQISVQAHVNEASPTGKVVVVNFGNIGSCSIELLKRIPWLQIEELEAPPITLRTVDADATLDPSKC